MASFKGQAEYSVDSKGRVAIPAKMRNALSPSAKNTFVVTRGFEQCVFLYPLDQWEAKEEEMRSLNTYRSQSRDFLRIVMMWADEVVLDGQGRIGLPKPLQDYAGIADKAMIVGAFDHIEIWNPVTLETYLTDQTEPYETLAERVMGSMDGGSTER